MVIIDIIDSGLDYYTLSANTTILGRMYDNKAEYIKVNKPTAESNNICLMYVSDYTGNLIDTISVIDEDIPIKNNISQYGIVNISFSFINTENKTKNSESMEFMFLESQKPYNFSPEPSEELPFDILFKNGFTDAKITNTNMQFYNYKGDLVKSLDLSGIKSAVKYYDITISSSNWVSDTTKKPFTYKATVTASLSLTDNSVVELVNDNPSLFMIYAFSIFDDSVTSTAITVYSIGKPTENITLKVGVTE